MASLLYKFTCLYFVTRLAVFLPTKIRRRSISDSHLLDALIVNTSVDVDQLANVCGIFGYESRHKKVNS